MTFSSSQNSRQVHLLKSMEIVGTDASKFVRLNLGDKVLFGRGSGFNTYDRTVSRHHVVFELKKPPDKKESEAEPRVCFEVVGKNPFWVCSHKDGEIRVFRKSNIGELEVGDRFCLSGKTPIWFNLKKGEGDLEAEKRILQVGDEVSGSLHDGFLLEELDVSGIDPVKEFGFVVMGHEFDHYPKHMIRSLKDWDWFLEEPKKNSDDEEEYGSKKRNVKAKRRNGKDNEDEEWTSESEEDKEVVAKQTRKQQGPNYHTRSRDSEGLSKGRGSSTSKQAKASASSKDVEEDDATLGGFIVDDEEDEDNRDIDEDGEEEEIEEDEDDEMED